MRPARALRASILAARAREPVESSEQAARNLVAVDLDLGEDRQDVVELLDLPDFDTLDHAALARQPAAGLSISLNGHMVADRGAGVSIWPVSFPMVDMSHASACRQFFARTTQPDTQRARQKIVEARVIRARDVHSHAGRHAASVDAEHTSRCHEDSLACSQLLDEPGSSASSAPSGCSRWCSATHG